MTTITLRNDSNEPITITAEDDDSIQLMPKRNTIVEDKFLSLKNGNSYPFGVVLVEGYKVDPPGVVKPVIAPSKPRYNNSVADE